MLGCTTTKLLAHERINFEGVSAIKPIKHQPPYKQHLQPLRTSQLTGVEAMRNGVRGRERQHGRQNTVSHGTHMQDKTWFKISLPSAPKPEVWSHLPPHRLLPQHQLFCSQGLEMTLTASIGYSSGLDIDTKRYHLNKSALLNIVLAKLFLTIPNHLR